ncbi:MAG: hypothetical protein KJ622_07335 [Alphaproteobacteria bacterium]|nr:hypothetical protein [Alphaproteobacteria bacterium]
MKMTAPLTVDAAATDAAYGFLAGKLIGLTLVAVMPALFWTAIFAIAANVVGADLSVYTVGGTAAAIMLFLATIYAAMASGSDKA